MNKSLQIRKLNKQERRQLKILMVLSDKGGVGKSLITRVLAQYFVDKALPIIGFDCDRSNQSFLDYYQDVIEMFLAFFSEDPKKAWNADFILDAALEHRKNVIVDTPAQVFIPFRTYLHQGGLKAAQRHNLQYIFILVIADRYSLEQFIDLAQEFGEDIPFILVLNEGCCDDFSFVEENDVFQDIIKQFNIPVITVPELPYREREVIDQLRFTFAEAIEASELSIVGRQRVADFLTAIYEQLDALNILHMGKKSS